MFNFCFHDFSPNLIFILRFPVFLQITDLWRFVKVIPLIFISNAILRLGFEFEVK